jgi:uncharacterized protein YjiS (DUF1127 family)
MCTSPTRTDRFSPSLSESPLVLLMAWRRRSQERAQLARMSDTDLHDIGLTSLDRQIEINKPCWRA